MTMNEVIIIININLHVLGGIDNAFKETYAT